MDKRQRPDVNKTGHTYKQIFKNWGGYATEDELKLLWGERVKGKTNYRLRNLTPDQYLEALGLYKKITGKPHADGGMVSRTFAIAYLLERKGEQVNWMSFWEQHQLEKQQKGLQDNILQEEALEGKASEGKASCNAKHKRRELSPQESPQEDEDESEESKKHMRKTKMSRVGASDVTTDKHTSEFRKTVITWVDSTTQALKIAKLELNESIRNQKELERKVELLNQDKSMIERDLDEWSELIKKQPDTATGVKYVSELKEKQLNDKILPELRFLRKKLQDMEMHTKLNTEEVSQLEPRLQRFIMCIKDFESPYSLEPSLPPIPLATELDGDIGCPYCGRSIIWEGLPLPVVVAECSHRYHIPCLSSHLRHTRRCCYYACNHDMSNIWLQSFGIKVTPPEEHKPSLFNINDAIAKKTTEMRMDHQRTQYGVWGLIPFVANRYDVS